jgi:hypothetical protein
MADILLSGVLDLTGSLNLVPPKGGLVKANGAPVLVELPRGGTDTHGTGTPVPLPPPAPTDPGTDVWVFRSYNSTITANDKAIITQGMCAIGSPMQATWPGIVQSSVVNPAVKINGVAMNVVGDLATILPTGAPATFTASGQ